MPCAPREVKTSKIEASSEGPARPSVAGITSASRISASRIRSPTQVLDASTGFLVEPEPESLAAGLIQGLTDPSGVEQRVRSACALYERDYSRSSYEGKIRRLLEMIA